MKAYSPDLRQRVVRAVDEGRTRAEIVQLFGVSLATIKRYLKQRWETGHLTLKAIPGHPAKKGMGEALILEGAADAFAKRVPGNFPIVSSMAPLTKNASQRPFNVSSAIIVELKFRVSLKPTYPPSLYG